MSVPCIGALLRARNFKNQGGCDGIPCIYVLSPFLTFNALYMWEFNDLNSLCSVVRSPVSPPPVPYFLGASVAELLMRLALTPLAPLCWGSNPMRGSCQLLRNNVFLQLWKLTAIYNQTWLKNGVKRQFTSPHINKIMSIAYLSPPKCWIESTIVSPLLD